VDADERDRGGFVNCRRRLPYAWPSPSFGSPFTDALPLAPPGPAASPLLSSLAAHQQTVAAMRAAATAARWEHMKLIAAPSQRINAVARAQAAGYTTPIRCSTDPALHCSIYALSTKDNLVFDWTIVARPPGGASGLYANMGAARTLFMAHQGVGAVTVYPVVWIDGPQGPVYGVMPDGGFGT
jgi:hypothetical protein